MFIGHYAAAFAAKAVRPVLPLWLLFVAVQLVDFVWAILIILGIEKIRIIPGYTPVSPLDLYHIPYSHSLVAGVIWSLAFGALYVAARRGAGTLTSAVILALAVFSHWLTDLIVHTPDLPVFYGDPKLGLGLWNNFWLSQGLEIGLLMGAFVWFLSVTQAASRWGKLAPWLLLALMIGLQSAQHMLEPPTNPIAFAVQGFAVFTLLAFLAWQVERTRSGKTLAPAGQV